jgi:PAS domain S-box-containing protein
LGGLDQLPSAALDAEGQILLWNAAAEGLLGYTAEDLSGKSIQALYCAQESASGMSASDLQRAWHEGCANIDGWWLRKDGSRVRARANLVALRNDEGEGVLLAFMRGIEPATSPAAASPPLDQLVGAVTDYAIFSLDPDGFVTSWNDGARNIKGYERHEIIGQHFSCFYPSDAIARRWPEYELQVARTEGRFEDEGWRIRKDGSSFWANVVITAIRDTQGILLGFCKITRDLTERRRQEEELRLSEQRLRTLMESLTDHAIFMLDSNGLITSWTTGSERLLGYPAAEIMWKHFSNLYRREDIAADLPWRELASAAGKGAHESTGWRRGKSGAPFRAHVVIRAVYDEREEPCGYAHILRAIDRFPDNSVNAQAVNAAEALRFLLGRELETRWLPVRNALDLLKARTRHDAVAGSMLETISREVEELADILHRLAEPAESPQGTPDKT